MAFTRDEIEAANKRAAARLSKTPKATGTWYDRRHGRLVIELCNGTSIGFKPHDAQGFEHAKPEQLTRVEISPSGLGLHFPAIDADIYLPALLEGFLGSRRWMAAQLGKAGGRARSPAKAAAVRQNGKLRTTLIIDGNLLERASKLTGIRQKTALVHAGLEALVAREAGRRLAALAGSEPALRAVPRRRSGAQR